MYIAQLPSVALHPESNDWLRRFAKFGYAAKGVVYAVIGILALQVALGNGGKLAGKEEAVRHLQRQPYGELAVVIIGVGLLAYAVWRLIEAVLNLQGFDNDAKGIVKRIIAFAGALLTGAVGVAALLLAVGQGSRGSGKTWVASLMSDSVGVVLLAVVALGILAAGLLQIEKGYKQEFLEELRFTGIRSGTIRWLSHFGRFGHIARGVVFVIVGGALGHAVLTYDPKEARTFAEALGEIASQPFGTFLLAVVALGLLAYGLFLILTVRYRRLGQA